MSHMSLHEIIRKRRMTRNFTEEPVVWEVVERIVDNARRGPSAGYSQGMAFVAVTDDAMRARLAEIAGEEWYVKSGHEPFMSRAPIHLIVTANESIYHQRYNEPDKKAKGQEEIGWPIPYWHTDAGAAMMLVLLSSEDVLNTVQDAVPAIELGGFIGVWMWLRYPLMLVIAVILISLLYYATPNVKQPKIRFLTPGAAIALVTMGLAGLGFSFYVSNFGSYNATYGLIGGVIVMLLFIWIMNNVLLLGAQIDAEIQRTRELQAGIKSEDEIKLPPRDDTQAIKIQQKKDNLVEEGRKIRLSNSTVDFQQMAEQKQDGSKK